MGTDSDSENLISLIAASKLIPSRPHISTLHRWRTRGVRGVRLETFLVGGRRYTSREAIDRFLTAINAAAAGQPTPVRTPRQRRRAIEVAERELNREGI